MLGNAWDFLRECVGSFRASVGSLRESVGSSRERVGSFMECVGSGSGATPWTSGADLSRPHVKEQQPRL